jgi:hypothetical protein
VLIVDLVVGLLQPGLQSDAGLPKQQFLDQRIVAVTLPAARGNRSRAPAESRRSLQRDRLTG